MKGMRSAHKWRQYASQRWPRLKRVYKRFVHRREHRHLQGHVARISDRPGAFVFCVHKAASTFLSQAVAYLIAQPARCLDVEGYLWNVRGTPVAAYLQEHAADVFHPDKGYVYCPVRTYLPDSVLEGAAGLVCVRDPRDVLVSHFHSISRSHIAPAAEGARERFFAARTHALELGLDAYVLDHLSTVEETFSGFADMVRKHGFKVLHYERMLDDFEAWVGVLGDVLSVPITDQRRHDLWAMSGLGQAAAGEGTHIRSRNPGQYLGLHEATQEVLNQRLGEVLETLGYSRGWRDASR